MKSKLTTIAVFSIIAMLAGAVNAVPNQPSQLISAENATTISQATEQVDLPLLAKSITNFFGSDRYQTESQIEFNVGIEDSEITIYLQTKIITQSDQKFRAEIAWRKLGEQTKSGNLVVSDGKQVWIYRADLQQYAVKSYQEFQDSGDWIFISPSSIASLQVSEQYKQVIANGGLSDEKVLAELGILSKDFLKGDRRTINGDSFYVYTYRDLKEKFTFTAFVQPETAILKQLQFAGTNQGTDIVLTEKILSRTANPLVNAQTFKFSPPKGAKRVKSLSLSQF
ncbi:hypothetical protein NIES2100_72310 [Calothrix sp. NIES-2100]|uniref:LolA family protein n=1 Tax=Calothrix sp. NIES-2100 TaxID=1954172 RepID=UPI000B5EB5FB|nr:hypothetical protein NIES2100_72310 [Calothrix sp. NIES-2100]